METNLRHNRLIIAPPLVRPASASQGLKEFAPLFFTTLTLGLFFAITTAGVWYFWTFFQNDSYKLVSSFLLLIMVSNILSKYGLWYLRHYANGKFMKKS
jgi:hypothetical protein